MSRVIFLKTDDVRGNAKTLFTSEKKKLTEIFPNAQIEHIGSTAIPCALTKGDIDINIRVGEKDFSEAVDTLKALYKINQPDNWTAAFASFNDDARHLGIQVTVTGSPDDCFVAQRDYFIDHPEVCAEYDVIKERCNGKDMEEYRFEKGKFFERLNLLLGR